MAVLKINNLAQVLKTPFNEQPVGPSILDLYAEPRRYSCSKIEGTRSTHRARFEFYDFDLDLSDDAEGKNPLVPEQFKLSMAIDRANFMIWNCDRVRQDLKNALLIVEFQLPQHIPEASSHILCVHFNHSYYIRGKTDWTPNVYTLNECHAVHLDKMFYKNNISIFYMDQVAKGKIKPNINYDDDDYDDEYEDEYDDESMDGEYEYESTQTVEKPEPNVSELNAAIVQ